VRLTDDEWAAYRRDGYLVRRGVFDEAELEELRAAGEEVIEQLVAIRRGQRVEAGAYTFELETASLVMIKWEGDSDVIQGIEPFAHFHPTFERVAADSRFLEPARDIVGTDVCLFTEKLNYKRARHGGPVVLHQDHPYWDGHVDDIERMMTIMLLLDDSTVENGCLHAVPGSHEWGEQPRKQVDGFGRFEMDDAGFDRSLLRPVELAAGDLVMFGPMLVHCSEPNRSDADRRALLYTYQPAGCRHTVEGLRPLAAIVERSP
jgi:ectoine hydroxylase-related dioxygenase (phytanoyl-CoA dioxygenase family)